MFIFGYISVFNKHELLDIYHTTVTSALMPKVTLLFGRAKIRDGGRQFWFWVFDLVSVAIDGTNIPRTNIAIGQCSQFKLFIEI